MPGPVHGSQEKDQRMMSLTEALDSAVARPTGEKSDIENSSEKVLREFIRSGEVALAEARYNLFIRVRQS